MRPANVTDEQIIEAGKQLQERGREVNGFSLRQVLGSGRADRLKSVWLSYIATQATENDEAHELTELPIDAQQSIEALASHIQQALNEGTKKLYRASQEAANRQTADLAKSLKEQRRAMESELSDAASTVDDLEIQLGKADEKIVTLEGELSEIKGKYAHMEGEIKQLRENHEESKDRLQTISDEKMQLEQALAEANLKLTQAITDLSSEKAKREVLQAQNDKLFTTISKEKPAETSKSRATARTATAKPSADSKNGSRNSTKVKAKAEAEAPNEAPPQVE